MEYIENSNREDGCIFCNAQEKEDSAENLIAFRGERSFVILNRYPYTSGHLMVIPFEHKATLEELDPETRAEMMELTARSMTILRNIYNPQALAILVPEGAAPKKPYSLSLKTTIRMYGSVRCQE